MNSPDLLLAVKPIIKTFEKLSIPYYIGGSIASSLYGMARATMDVDMVVNISLHHVSSLVDSLQDAYYVDEPMILEAIETSSSFNLIHLATMMKIDVFVQKQEPFHQSALKRKRVDQLVENDSESLFYFYSPEDILLHKLLWYEMGQQISERQWLDVLGIIKVQSGSLDRSYLKQWARALDVFDLLTRAFEQAGQLL